MIGGTLFEHKEIHKTTWTSPKGDTKTQIDHICINKRWKRSLCDVRSYRGADINTTHHLVKGKVKLKLSSQRKKEKDPKPNLGLLRSGEKVDEYQNRLQETPMQVTPESTIEDDWNSIVKTYQDVSKQVIGKLPPRNIDQHLSVKTIDLIEQRNQLKKVKPTVNVSAQYSAINKQVKKSVKNDDNKWAENIAKNLQQAANTGNQREVWKNIKILSGKSQQKSSTSVRDKDGKFITDPQKKLERWKEHFEELLNHPISDTPVPIPDENNNSEIYFPDLPLDPPTADEIQKGLSKLKNHKAGGVDEISNEQLKYGGHATTEKLLPLLEKT